MAESKLSPVTKTKYGYSLKSDIFIWDKIYVPSRDDYFEVEAISFTGEEILYGYTTEHGETKWNTRKDVKRIEIEK